MDCYSTRSTTYIPSIRRIRIVHEGGEVSYTDSDHMETDSVASVDRMDSPGVHDETPTCNTVPIPDVAHDTSFIRGVRVRTLLAFIAGIIFSFVIQTGLAILLTGP